MTLPAPINNKNGSKWNPADTLILSEIIAATNPMNARVIGKRSQTKRALSGARW